ncbi:MAG TPA: SDR family oxidoreductase [Gammaproteobacteria bacterium]|jgi:NAD(P)-dependent dehydrogenase (short-subunit alcohol dehydrogenase family)|nr:SDR family oxidoreductase [Gammaproteobacteria bacterium]
MQTILITGANRGIGLEMTKQYLTAGWQVFACCRNPQQADALKQLKTQHNNQLIIIKLDVRNLDEIQQLPAQLNHQPIDILMNNAGVIGSRAATLQDSESANWLETFKINTLGPALLTQTLLDQVAKSKLKLIVNISSSMGSISANTEGGYYLYRASKAGLNAITKSLAVDLKEKNITVIAIHPGWVKTDMGGEHALISPEQSVAGIRQVLEKITLQDTGAFIKYNGDRLAW